MGDFAFLMLGWGTPHRLALATRRVVYISTSFIT